MNEIQEVVEETRNEEFLDIFKSRDTRRAFAISMGLIFFQQFSGIMAVVACAQSIFEKSGGQEVNSVISSIIIGVVPVFFALITPFTSDKLQRTGVLVISSMGMAISEGPLAILSTVKDFDKDVKTLSLIPLIFLLFYMISYSFGYGSVPWKYLKEILPRRYEKPASMLASSFCFTLSFFVMKFFGTSEIGIGIPFLIFTACGFLSIVFTKKCVIETKKTTINI